MLESFFWGIACIICCFVGAYLYCEHNSKVLATLTMILGVLMLFITIFYSTFSAIGDTRTVYEEIIKEKDAQIEFYALENDSHSPDSIKIETLSGCLVHKAAEIGECYQLLDGNWSIPFYVEGNQTHIYIWEDTKPYEDVPYLVVMDDMGTTDPTDDALVTVWACVK